MIGDSILDKPVGHKFYQVILIVILFIWIFAGGCAVLLYISHERASHGVQQALDEQCGVDIVSVNKGTIYYDPNFTWHSPTASCYFDDATRKLECSCPAP